MISVEHHREGMDISVAETEVELTSDARPAHGDELMAAFDDQGYATQRVL